MANSAFDSYISESFFEEPLLTFDDTLLNVPEAQAQDFYCNYETIDDKLGFTNPFEYIPPPPSDPILIARQHNPRRFYRQALARIQMEDLDNGTGRMIPGKKLLPSKPRLYSDTQARAQAIEEDRLSRLYDDPNPRRVERAYHAAPPTYYTQVDEMTGQLRVVSVNPQAKGESHSRLSDSDTEVEFDIDMSGPDVEPIVAFSQDHYAQFVVPQSAIRGLPSPGVPPTIDPLDLDPSLRDTVAYRRFTGPPSACKSGRAGRTRKQAAGASTKKRVAFDPIHIGNRKNKPCGDSVTPVAASSNVNKLTSRGRKKKGSEVY